MEYGRFDKQSCLLLDANYNIWCFVIFSNYGLCS